MNLEIVSYDGVSLNDANFKAYFPAGSVMLMAEGQPGFVERSYFGPVFTYKRRMSRTIPVHVLMLGTIASQVDTLKALFNPFDLEEHKLLAQDKADSNKQWYLMGTPISMPDIDGQEVIFNLWVANPIWKREVESTQQWAITANGDQEVVSVGGSFYAEPTFSITPTAAKSGGKAYRIFCPVYNPSSIVYDDYPLDIVNNGLDTAALIADNANKCQINQVGGIDAVVTTIPYDTVTGTIPSAGMGYVDTEQISWTGKTGTVSGNLTGCTRGVNGTSAATHADNAEIKVSKMEADGGDIQVTVDGIQVDYWLQDINNATTQVWINLDLSIGRNTTLGVAIAGSGSIDSITLENSTANIDALNAMPSVGLVLIGSELFSYTGKNVTTRQLLGIARAAHNTSMAAHSVGVAIYWIEHEIYIYHGLHDLPVFTVNNENKPYIELNSTNAAWKWDATFCQTDVNSYFKLKTGIWRKLYPNLWTASDTYARSTDIGIWGYYESMSISAPSTQTGTQEKTMSVLGEWTATLGYLVYYLWSVHVPAGFTHIAANGNRWLSSAAGADWFRVDAGYYMFRKAYSTTPPGYASFADAFNVAAPGVYDTIDAWTQAALDLGGTYNYLYFLSQRTSANKDGEARIEVTDLTFTLNSNNIPVAAAGSSVEYYHINAELVNVTTGAYLSLDYNLNLNTALIINTAEKTIIDEDSGAYERGAMALSTYRHDWLRLEPGSNTLQWNEAGVVAVTIDIAWRERKL